VASRWLCNKKFGTVNMFSSAICWSIWKSEEFSLFPGGHLDMNENDMATGGSDVEMLEGAGSDELDGWL
jgi:hypothetical protein